MANLLFGVPPQGRAATAPIETGVYLRLGTYVNDTAHPVDEYSQMPATYKPSNADAATSEGIFITSAGTYIVTALDEGHIEVLDGVTLALTGDEGSMTTTVDEGEVVISIEKGSLGLQGNSGFNVTSTDGDISISAKKGKVSSKGDYVYTHTFGSYIKIAHANKKSGTNGPDTNVSMSLNFSFYGAVLFSAKLMTVSFKIYSATITLFSLTVNVIAFDFNMSARAYLSEDVKFAYLYIKYRGVQLESDKAAVAVTAGQKNKLGLVSLDAGLTKANTSIFKAAFGLTSEIPAPTAPPPPPVTPPPPVMPPVVIVPPVI